MWVLWLVQQSEGFAGRQLRHIAVRTAAGTTLSVDCTAQPPSDSFG